MESSKRLVLFAGPHKSASSAVQEFFMRYASNRKEKHPALINWTWPHNPRVRSYLPRKGFAPLVVEYENEELRQSIYARLHRLWTNHTSNIIFGSEEFDRFGDTPWSHRNGMLAIRDILGFTKPDDFSIVVNYRTPRQEQWVSIWKQLTRTHPIPYREYLCKEDTRTWEYLDSVANPLGLVQAFRSNNWKVTLIDMGGVEEHGLDVAHVVACEVLNVPCVGGWLEGPEQILQNNKTGDPEMSEQQLEEMEWILRQRDCAYKEKMERDSSINILHRHSLWKDCSSPNADFSNTTFLLNLLRAQMNCGKGEVNVSDMIHATTPPTSAMKIKTQVGDHARGSYETPGRLQEAAKLQFLVLVFSLIFSVGVILRQRKSCKTKQRR
jgi:hypothetical protein